MKLLVQIFIVFFFIGSLQGQLQYRSSDSLRKALSELSAEDRAGKVELLIKFSSETYYNDTSLAFGYASDALLLAQATRDKELMAKAAKNLGKLYYRKSDFSNALKYFKLTLQYNTDAGDVNEMAASYNNIGVVFNRLGYYDLALQNHLQQQRINEETGNLQGLAISNRNIGNIYINLKENDKALQYYQASLEISEQLDDSTSIATALINLGVVNTELERYEQARRYLSKALMMKINTNDKVNITVLYANLGVVAVSQNDLRQAISYFEQSLELARQINHRHYMAVALKNLGESYLKLGEPVASYGYLMEALTVSKQIDARDLTASIHATLSRWYEEQNDFAQALDNFRVATTIRDSLLNSEKSRQMKNMQLVYEVEKKESEILGQKVAIERLKTGQVYLLLGIVIVLALVFVFYYRYRTKRKLSRQLEEKVAIALNKEKEQQQIIAHQSSLTSLGELASAIAHEIKQPLQNILLANEDLQIENAAGKIDKNTIADITSDINEDIRRIKFIISEVSNFSRGQLEDITEWFDANTHIKNAFSLARIKFSNNHIRVDFDLDENIPNIRGNPYKFEQVVVIFYNNAKDAIDEKEQKLEEAFDKMMRVKSYCEGTNVIIEVADNGIGIPEINRTRIFMPFFTTKPLGKGSGLGLSISLGIAKEMDGRIEMESREMEGTVMRLMIPLKKI
ncbi:MAG: tetratricopeptide repeat protein [Clostridia bacterium]|nr:tetratricopeptide repeat protein [Clostridia bacterium]